MTTKKGIRSYADLPAQKREVERVAKQYREWSFNTITQALQKEGLLAPAGLAQRIGVMNGMCVATAAVCKASGASKDDLLRVIGKIYGEVDEFGSPMTPKVSDEK